MNQCLKAQELWQALQQQVLKHNSNNVHLLAWLNQVTVHDLVELPNKLKCLVLKVPTSLHQRYLSEDLLPHLFNAAHDLSESVTFQIILDPTVEKPVENPVENYVENPVENPVENSTPYPSNHSFFRNSLDPNLTFSTFVVGKNTEFAHAACYNAAQNPGDPAHNPLLICGPVGMGKTHLLHALGHEVLARYPEKRVLYIQAEKFLNEFISALRHKKVSEFRQKYRDKVDVLLFDDVQFIGKGESTQEEFFHIFNSLIERHKQIVLASDRRPREILKLDDRNRSRLEWGLTVDITMPDLETRMAILRFKAELLAIPVPDDVVLYVAQVAKRSIREMEGALKTLKMFSDLQGVPITLNLAKKVLQLPESPLMIHADEILKLVAEEFDITLTEIKGTERSKRVNIPRQIAIYLLKKHFDKSFSEIGRLLGNRDHSTIMNAYQKAFELLSDPQIKIRVDELEQQIYQMKGLD